MLERRKPGLRTLVELIPQRPRRFIFNLHLGTVLVGGKLPTLLTSAIEGKILDASNDPRMVLIMDFVLISCGSKLYHLVEQGLTTTDPSASSSVKSFRFFVTLGHHLPRRPSLPSPPQASLPGKHLHFCSQRLLELGRRPLRH